MVSYMEYYVVIKNYADLYVLILGKYPKYIVWWEWVSNKVACVVWATLGLKKKYLNIYA